MSARYTPGPWCVHERTAANQPIVVGRPEIGQRRTLVKVYQPLGSSEMEHNARLIAAAPDLLEALQNAEQHIVTMLTAIAGGNTQAGARLADKDAVVIAIRAAIAKATGGAA